MVPVLLLALGALVAIPGPANAGGPVGSCLCCWEEFNPWPIIEHVTDNAASEEKCKEWPSFGDHWVAFGEKGTHDDPEDGPCLSTHGDCDGGGENFTLAMELARDGDAEGLIPMLDTAGGYVRMALDGAGIQVLTCDLSRVVAWVPLTGDVAELVARRGAIQREISSADE